MRDFAFASGSANLLRAVPDLEERGRKPLLDGTVAGVKAFATTAKARLDRAISARAQVPAGAGVALVSGYRAKPVLNAAIKNPASVAAGGLDAGAPIGDALRFANVSLRGWWR